MDFKIRKMIRECFKKNGIALTDTEVVELAHQLRVRVNLRRSLKSFLICQNYDPDKEVDIFKLLKENSYNEQDTE